MGRNRCAAVRILPGRTDHDGGRVARANATALRRRDYDGDVRQHLPLRNVHADPTRRSPRRRDEHATDSAKRRHGGPMKYSREDVLNANKNGTVPEAAGVQSRRTFLKVSATAAGGLLVAIYARPDAVARGANASFQPNAFIRVDPDD